METSQSTKPRPGLTVGIVGRQFDRLPAAACRTIRDPAAVDACAAWALDFGADGEPSVTVLSDPFELPSRPPFADEVFLWFAAPGSEDYDALLPYLDEAECARLGKLSRSGDRWSFAAAHAGARCLLARALGCTSSDIAFTRSARGKPGLDPLAHRDTGTRIHFSLSHTQGVVAVAMAGRPVGVDVERMRAWDDLDDIAETALSPEALSPFSDVPEEAIRKALFYRFWTLGEAFIKATGEGLSQGLKTFAFSAAGTPRLTAVSADWGPPDRWRFGVLPG